MPFPQMSPIDFYRAGLHTYLNAETKAHVAVWNLFEMWLGNVDGGSMATWIGRPRNGVLEFQRPEHGINFDCLHEAVAHVKKLIERGTIQVLGEANFTLIVAGDTPGLFWIGVEDRCISDFNVRPTIPR